jgi:hypothetical protein
MMDMVAYVIGYGVIGAVAIFVSVFMFMIIYWAFTALLDVLSQYYLLWREKREPVPGVTFWQAYCSSYSWQDKIWARIWYRVKRAHGVKATHPFDEPWQPGG